ncbi:MAG: hypothetical protein ACTTIT_02320 [Treponema sp.]
MYSYAGSVRKISGLDKESLMLESTRCTERNCVLVQQLVIEFYSK